MHALLRAKLPEVIQAVVPLLVVVCAFQVLLVRAPLELFLQFLGGALLTLFGMLLLLAGIDFGILPMGRFIGAELPVKGSVWLIVGVAFALGLATTAAEPDVLVLATQVDAASDGAIGGQPLVYVIATGVGLFASLALLRIVAGFSMVRMLTIIFVTIIVLALAGPETFIPVAFDAGSVTTGVLTAPVLLAVTLGLSAVLAQRSAVADGFGLLGIASSGPILAILLLGLLLS